MIEKKGSGMTFFMAVDGSAAMVLMGTVPAREDGSIDIGNGDILAPGSLSGRMEFTVTTTDPETVESVKALMVMAEPRLSVGYVAEGDEIVKGVDEHGDYIVGRLGDEG